MKYHEVELVKTEVQNLRIEFLKTPPKALLVQMRRPKIGTGLEESTHQHDHEGVFMHTQELDSNPTPMRIGFLIPAGQTPVQATEVTSVCTVGRHPQNSLVLNDPFVSTRHARIEKTENGFSVRDLGSRNGTFVNGLRVREAVLTPHDRLRFGETLFIFSETASKNDQLTSRNLRWNEQLQRLPIFAATEFAVLITGPSGSGKDVLARAIHQHSPRAQGPFVTINCSALSETLIESELFGHVRGSFTGATHDRKGAFESARRGTLFLDEIGDLPLSLQPKLLRAIENREIRPVGSDRTIETDVRIIAATHKNLAQQVQTGGFREDLYFRINVCHIQPPALSERLEDFETLLYRFAREQRVRFSFAAIERLKEHSWPGQVRELKNLVARTAAYFPGAHIQPQHIETLLEGSLVTRQGQNLLDDLALAKGEENRSIIKEIEREMIINRLVANRGNQRRVAAELGLPKSTLHDRIRHYKIDINELIKTHI